MAVPVHDTHALRKKGSEAQKALTSDTPWIMNLQVRMIESSRRHHYGETWPRSSTYSTRAPEADLTWPGLEPTTPCTAGEHSSKELLQQLMLLIFGSSTWLPQCMALMHSTRSKTSNSTYKWHTLNIILFESRRCHHYGETLREHPRQKCPGPGLNLQPHALLPSTQAKSYCNSLCYWYSEHTFDWRYLAKYYIHPQYRCPSVKNNICIHIICRKKTSERKLQNYEK